MLTQRGDPPIWVTGHPIPISTFEELAEHLLWGGASVCRNGIETDVIPCPCTSAARTKEHLGPARRPFRVPAERRQLPLRSAQCWDEEEPTAVTLRPKYQAPAVGGPTRVGVLRGRPSDLRR